VSFSVYCVVVNTAGGTAYVHCSHSTVSDRLLLHVTQVAVSLSRLCWTFEVIQGQQTVDFFSPLGVCSAKRRHQSPEWTILSCALSIASFRERLLDFRSCWIVDRGLVCS